MSCSAEVLFFIELIETMKPKRRNEMKFKPSVFGGLLAAGVIIGCILLALLLFA